MGLGLPLGSGDIDGVGIGGDRVVLTAALAGEGVAVVGDQYCAGKGHGNGQGRHGGHGGVQRDIAGLHILRNRRQWSVRDGCNRHRKRQRRREKTEERTREREIMIVDTMENQREAPPTTQQKG